MVFVKAESVLVGEGSCFRTVEKEVVFVEAESVLKKEVFFVRGG